MNIIIAIFLYLGLTYPGDTITREEIEEHAGEIEATSNDPGFIEYYSTLDRSGIVSIYIYEGN